MSTTTHSRPRGVFLPGLAKQNPSLQRELKARFGYSAVRLGDDFVVPFSDPAFGRGINDVLTVGPSINLHKVPLLSVAKELISRIPTDYDAYKPDLPSRVGVASGFGLFDIVDEISLQLTIKPKHHLEQYLSDVVLPRLQSEFNFNYVTSVSISSSYLQAIISFAKIVYLLDEFGLKNTEKKLFQDKSLNSILPHPLSILEYMQAFILLSPFAVALPFDRPGCVWYFWKDGLISFPHAATHSILEEFKNHYNPLSQTGNTILLEGLSLSKDNILHYINMIALLLNNTIKYFFDIKNYKNSAGDFDSYRFIQSISGLNLLFSDLLSLNTTSDTFLRAHFSFTALEKIANMKKEMGGLVESESTVAQKLLSLRQGRWIRKELAKAIGPLSLELAKDFSKMTKSFSNLHKEIARQMDAGRFEEKYRLQTIRSQRNVLIHGAFLSKDQFKNAYVHSRGIFPAQIPNISLLTTLGMMANPSSFLKFSASVKGL